MTQKKLMIPVVNQIKKMKLHPIIHNRIIKNILMVDTRNYISFDYIAEPSKTISGFAKKNKYLFIVY